MQSGISIFGFVVVSGAVERALERERELRWGGQQAVDDVGKLDISAGTKIID